MQLERRTQALVQLDQEHAQRDGISERRAVQLRQEGEFRIQHILILDAYLDWLKTQRLPHYTDPELVQLDEVYQHYPFHGGHFPRDPDLLLAAVSRCHWLDYVRDTELEVEHEDVMGLPRPVFYTLSRLRTLLVRRHFLPRSTAPTEVHP